MVVRNGGSGGGGFGVAIKVRHKWHVPVSIVFERNRMNISIISS